MEPWTQIISVTPLVSHKILKALQNIENLLEKKIGSN